MRERVGLTECSNFAKYRVTGDGAAEWLQGLFTNRLPKVGPHRPDGDAQPGRPDRRRVLRRPGRRRRVLPVRLAGRRGAPLAVVPRPSARRTRAIRFEVLGLSLVGLSVAGPHARDVLQSVTDDVAGHRRLPVHGVPPASTSAWSRRGSGG